jgi:hypothetical protein
MSGEKNHRSRTGPATASTIGVDAASWMATPMAITGPIHIDRQERASSLRARWSGWRSASLEGFHSSSRRRVISSRQLVRTIASRLKNAS